MSMRGESGPDQRCQFFSLISLLSSQESVVCAEHPRSPPAVSASARARPTAQGRVVKNSLYSSRASHRKMCCFLLTFSAWQGLLTFLELHHSWIQRKTLVVLFFGFFFQTVTPFGVTHPSDFAPTPKKLFHLHPSPGVVSKALHFYSPKALHNI